MCLNNKSAYPSVLGRPCASPRVYWVIRKYVWRKHQFCVKANIQQIQNLITVNHSQGTNITSSQKLINCVDLRCGDEKNTEEN